MTTKIQVKGSAVAADAITFDGKPSMLTKFAMQRKANSSVIVVPGRAAPVVVFHPMRKRSGSLEFVVADEATARALDALLARPVAFTLTDTTRPFYNMDFAIADGGYSITLDDQTRARFVATIEAVEL